jgi:hypothetical protein
MVSIYAKCFVGLLVVNLNPDSLVALRAVKLTGLVPILNVKLFAAMRALCVETHYPTSKPFASRLFRFLLLRQ